MTANVTIEVARVHDALRIPNAALRWRPEAKTTGSPEERAAGSAIRRGGRPRWRARPAARPERRADRLRPSPAGGGDRQAPAQTVYKLRTGKEEPVPVEIKTGITDGRVTVVVSGPVAPGENVGDGRRDVQGEHGWQRRAGRRAGRRRGRRAPWLLSKLRCLIPARGQVPPPRVRRRSPGRLRHRRRPTHRRRSSAPRTSRGSTRWGRWRSEPWTACRSRSLRASSSRSWARPDPARAPS